MGRENLREKKDDIGRSDHLLSLAAVAASVAASAAEADISAAPTDPSNSLLMRPHFIFIPKGIEREINVNIRSCFHRQAHDLRRDEVKMKIKV